MKLLAVQLSLLILIIICLLLVVGVIIPFIATKLSIYGITDEVVLNENVIIILVLMLHFIVGANIVNKFKKLRSFKSIYILAVFTFIYLGFSILVRYLKDLPDSFHLLELSLLVCLFLGLVYRTYHIKYIRVGSIIVLISFLFFTALIIIPLSNQYNLYQNFAGGANKEITHEVQYMDSKMSTVALTNSIDSTVYVLDFWNNSCAKCFKKFPKLKDLQKSYNNKSNIKVLAVNVYNSKSDVELAKKLLHQTQNYDMDNIFMDTGNATYFDVQWFPKTVVLKNNKIVFEGNLETLLIFENTYLK